MALPQSASFWIEPYVRSHRFVNISMPDFHYIKKKCGSSHIDSRPMALPQSASFRTEPYVRSHARISEDCVIVFVTKIMRKMMLNIKYADPSLILLHMCNNHMWLTLIFQCLHLHLIFSTEWKIVKHVFLVCFNDFLISKFTCINVESHNLSNRSSFFWHIKTMLSFIIRIFSQYHKSFHDGAQRYI